MMQEQKDKGDALARYQALEQHIESSVQHVVNVVSEEKKLLRHKVAMRILCNIETLIACEFIVTYDHLFSWCVQLEEQQRVYLEDRKHWISKIKDLERMRVLKETECCWLRESQSKFQLSTQEYREISFVANGEVREYCCILFRPSP